MAVVQMKCPNCGGTMELVNNQFKCPNCRTMLLNIVDAKIDADVTVMTPDEFARKIEESKRQFVVNINDNLKVFDVNTMVINKKIQDATQALELGDFNKVLSILDGLPCDVLSIERLRFLAGFQVKNEYELSFYDGYIDTGYRYKNILYLADEQTKETYQKLAEYCREQYDTKKRIESEILEVNKLLDVKLYQEAIAYTKEMCKKYPQTALSWAYACEVKCNISKNYNCDFEYVRMKKCPDYSEDFLPSLLQNKINEVNNQANKYYETKSNFAFSFFGIGSSLSLAVIVQIIYCLIMSGSGDGFVALLSLPFYLLSLALAIGTIVMIVKTITNFSTMCRKKKRLMDIINSIPEEEKIKSKRSTKGSDTLIMLAPLTLVIGILLTLYFFTSFMANL